MSSNSRTNYAFLNHSEQWKGQNLETTVINIKKVITLFCLVHLVISIKI